MSEFEKIISEGLEVAEKVIEEIVTVKPSVPEETHTSDISQNTVVSDQSTTTEPSAETTDQASPSDTLVVSTPDGSSSQDVNSSQEALPAETIPSETPQVEPAPTPVVPSIEPAVSENTFETELITADQLKAALPSATAENVNKFLDPLNAAMTKFEINTPLRIAGFLSQVAVESGSFAVLVENLNYSARGLADTFYSHFSGTAQMLQYQHKPEAIANRVYANRDGNGNEASGDGWKYRGHGLIQITFKDEFKACGESLGLDLVSDPDLLLQPTYAALSAAWFWNSKNINAEADARDVKGMTEKVNGGLNGFAQRQAAYKTACTALGV